MENKWEIFGKTIRKAKMCKVICFKVIKISLFGKKPLNEVKSSKNYKLVKMMQIYHEKSVIMMG